MIYKEEKRDLFTVDESYFLAHCISADFKLGAGIAVEFNKRFNMREKLQELVPWGNNEDYWDADKSHHGYCLKVGNIFNLVTKRNYWDKPTLQTMKNALVDLRDLYCYYPGVKIAMPKIGCGLDRLNWDDVSALIQEVFKDTDVEILVCIRKL